MIAPRCALFSLGALLRVALDRCVCMINEDNPAERGYAVTCRQRYS